jgi:hypothetical protein
MVSVGSGRGVAVKVGIGVTVRVGRGINVSVEGMLVDVFTGMGEEGAVGFPLFALQAFVIKNISISISERFTFILLLY